MMTKWYEVWVAKTEYHLIGLYAKDRTEAKEKIWDDVLNIVKEEPYDIDFSVYLDGEFNED